MGSVKPKERTVLDIYFCSLKIVIAKLGASCSTLSRRQDFQLIHVVHLEKTSFYGILISIHDRTELNPGNIFCWHDTNLDLSGSIEA